ncbi:MAG: sulfite exporter TauE/SafE family protein [Acidobacteria bacterium]|jgi:thiol:disulfide interchange protein DsbD|nr:sulfite exporter TauE/SafE family protein [Acidobacteriota bacterium]MBA3806095.1 sulfite exporter TauE/SafE family protein [Acidobacteriota bacterium]
MDGFTINLQEYLSSNSLLAYPAAFVAGLLISFTPCVYPIIPIQLGFIGGQTAAVAHDEKGHASLRGFSLSMMFVTGMSIVYAALGAFAALTQTLFGRWASSPWTYIFVANIVLVMALSMLDVFQLQTPRFLTRWNPERKGKGYLSALLVGAASGLVVGPCTAPALGAALTYVGTQGNVAFGASVLFVFAFGMGALMIALGTFGGALASLPRSGAWMVKIKKAFGVVMLLLAEYLLIQAGQRFI